MRRFFLGLSSAAFLAVTLTGALLGGSAAAAGSGPMATLKQKNGELDKVLRQKAGAGTPEEKKAKDDIKSLAGTLFDYAELAKRSLADHWAKLTTKQQTEFTTTLRDLIERNYARQMRTNLDYQVVYKTEELTGAEATVTTIVKVKTKGKATDAEIVYKMKKPESPSAAWMVYDVITDEVSLVRNYRTQFGKIITEKSYDELIKKMKTKLAEPQL
jgi:phospholipid transport system substrate-binding protein